MRDDVRSSVDYVGTENVLQGCGMQNACRLFVTLLFFRDFVKRQKEKNMTRITSAFLFGTRPHDGIYPTLSSHLHVANDRGCVRMPAT
jgi:hypothetical protein